MDHTTIWLAHERTIEARRQAAEDRQGRIARRASSRRPLLQRIRGDRD
jgi:hypothetical protein